MQQIIISLRIVLKTVLLTGTAEELSPSVPVHRLLLPAVNLFWQRAEQLPGTGLLKPDFLMSLCIKSRAVYKPPCLKIYLTEQEESFSA